MSADGYATRAAVFDPGQWAGPRVEDLTLPPPGPGELIVAMRAVGICHTDLLAPAVLPAPMVAGHEGAGIVEAVGPGVTALKPGDRVVATFGSCGACEPCAGDDPAHCHEMPRLNFALDPILKRPDGTAVHGRFFQQSSFATRALTTERNTVKLPDGMAFELAAPLACGVQTGYGAVVNVLDARAGQSIVVFGLGAVGLSAVLAARDRGLACIVGIDPIPERRALAMEFGATHVAAPGEDFAAALPPKGALYALDCAGVESAFQAGLAALRPLGVLGVIAIPAGVEPIRFSPLELLNKAARIVGVLEGGSAPQRFIPELCARVLAGTLPIERLVRRYRFDDIGAAWADAESGAVIKPVLVFDPSA